MKFGLWIDDERHPKAFAPQEMEGEPIYWVQAFDYEGAIKLLTLHFEQGSPLFDIVSLDNDLGLGKTGYDIIKKVEKWLHEDKDKGEIESLFLCPEFCCHSQNPVGRKNITACIESIKKTLRIL